MLSHGGWDSARSEQTFFIRSCPKGHRTTGKVWVLWLPHSLAITFRPPCAPRCKGEKTCGCDFSTAGWVMMYSGFAGLMIGMNVIRKGSEVCKQIGNGVLCATL